MHYGLPRPAPVDTTITVRMLKTTRAIPFPGSPAVIYDADHEYDLPEWLAEAFFRGGEADPAEAHAQHGETSQEGPGEAGAPDGPEVGSKNANARPRGSMGRRKSK